VASGRKGIGSRSTLTGCWHHQRVSPSSFQVSSERPFYAEHAEVYDVLITDPVGPWVEAVHARAQSSRALTCEAARRGLWDGPSRRGPPRSSGRASAAESRDAARDVAEALLHLLSR